MSNTREVGRGGRHFVCINNHNIKTFQQIFSPYTHTHTHTHVPTQHALTQAESNSLTYACTPIYSRAHTRQITHTHAGALTSTTNEKGARRKRTTNLDRRVGAEY